MRKMNKKGFTIVELVIVIAVIAILAAVLIPTYSSLVKKANQSADIQAVREMNTQLAIDGVETPTTLDKLYKVLKEGGMTAEDYHPLTSDTYFFWDADENRVVYTDKDYKVIYPEGSKEYTATSRWFSLSGEIKTVEVEIPESKTVDVSSAEMLYSLAKLTKESKNALAGGLTVNITADINAMGANIVFGEVPAGQTLTIKGNNHTLSNINSDQYGVSSDGSGQFQNGKAATYYCGFISSNKGTLKIEKLTFDGVLSDMSADKDTMLTGGSSCVGVVVGQNTGALTLDNVVVKNSTVKGYTKVGAFVGHNTMTGSITLKHCALENNTVVAECDGADPEAGYAALIVGYQTGNITIDDGIKLENNTVKMDESVVWAKNKLTTDAAGTVYTNAEATTNYYWVICNTYINGNYDMSKGKANAVQFTAGSRTDGYLELVIGE